MTKRGPRFPPATEWDWQDRPKHYMIGAIIGFILGQLLRRRRRKTG